MAAMALADLGWSIIPLCHPDHEGASVNHKETCTRPGKQPTIKWKELQEKPLGRQGLMALWDENPSLNLGVVTGLVSRIVMVDIDTAEGEEEWLSLVGPESRKMTWEFSTGREGGGRHLVFAWPFPAKPSGNPFKGLTGKLDFLGEGRQSVLPPSLHKSGAKYKWTRGGPATGLVIAEAPQSLVKAVMEAGKESREPVGGDVPKLTPRNSSSYLRASAYARGFQPAIQGEGGSGVLFNLADKLVHGFGLAVSDACTIIQFEWNKKCQPPWSVVEILRAVERAKDRGNSQPIPERPLDNARPVATSAARPGGSNGAIQYGIDRNGCDVESFGTLASSLNTAPTTWFFSPFVPYGMLTALVGWPTVGKSTFLAFLCSKAKRTFFLPGEEDVRVSLLPRLDVHGVRRESVRVVEPNQRVLFPDCLDRFAQAVKHDGADLVIIDPIDDYMADGLDDNNTTHVRTLLQSLRHLAERTGAAVIMCRHPGKQAGNVMAGSRAWRAVPRSIVELVLDPGPPERRMIRSYKDSLGQNPAPRYFDLVGETGQPKLFTMRELVDEEAVLLAKDMPDRVDRLKIEEAKEFLAGVLANGEVEGSQVYKQAETDRLGDRLLRRAAEMLGVRIRRQGHGKEHKSFWSLPPATPDGEGEGCLTPPPPE